MVVKGICVWPETALSIKHDFEIKFKLFFVYCIFFIFYCLYSYSCPHFFSLFPLHPSPCSPSLRPSPHHCLCLWVINMCSLANSFTFFLPVPPPTPLQQLSNSYDKYLTWWLLLKNIFLLLLKPLQIT